MFVEAWCAGCAWAAYAYHPLYAVPPEVYGATNVSSARGIQHAQCARPASKDHTNEQRITPMKHQDVSSLPPWVPPGSACAPKGSPGWHGGAPAGVTAPSTYADCLKMPRDRRTARKIPNGHGHGAPASSRSDAKCKDGSNAGEKPTKTDSQTAGKPVRGPSSKRTHGSGTVKFPESSPEPVTVPVKSKAQNQKSSRRSRGRASHSSTETVRPVRDA
ncbi:hypothetical protein C8Q70DRAFT_988301 [Cubamyces menziesii]|nr:hypothetical protein C8Q70DRAFT_988301 [Cubamyces menziesii]